MNNVNVTYFDARVFLIGTSKAVIIPKVSLGKLKLTPGDIVKVTIEK